MYLFWGQTKVCSQPTARYVVLLQVCWWSTGCGCRGLDQSYAVWQKCHSLPILLQGVKVLPVSPGSLLLWIAPLQPDGKNVIHFTTVHTVYPFIFLSLVLDMVSSTSSWGTPKKFACPGCTLGSPPMSVVLRTSRKGGNQEAVLLSAHITSTSLNERGQWPIQ